MSVKKNSRIVEVGLVLAIAMIAVLVVGAAQAVIRGIPEQGKVIFEERCASCHGVKGRGDGPRAPFLSPRPASLISAGTSAKSDQELLEVITNGKPRTDMPGWKDLLNEQERLDVVAYIRVLIRFQPEPLTPKPPNDMN